MKPSLKLFRVLLEVADLDEVSNFYSALLANQGRRVAPSRHYYVCGPVIVGLVDVSLEGGEPAAAPEYLYFAVSDLEAFYERARRLNCLSKEDVHGEPAGEIIIRPWGERSFYVVDPFGNGLCFVDEKTLFTGA